VGDLLPATQQADGDGDGVGRSQADDANTRKGVKGSGGAKVNDAEEDLDNHAEHHGVERHIELGVDLGPPAGAGDGAVAGKGPGAAGGGGGAADAAEEGEDNEGDEQAESAASRTHGRLDDDGDGLRGEEELLDVGQDKDEGDEEEEPGKGVDEDGGDHGLGHLGRRLPNLFAHGDNHAGRRSRVAGVKQTDTKRPTVGPSGAGLEMGKDVFGRVAAVLGQSKDSDGNGNDTSKSPENGGSLQSS
jgi:hypothetical protein